MGIERDTGAMKKTGYGRFNPQTQLRLRSGLEMQREMEMPSDIEGEDVIMAGQASYQDGMVTRTNWKPGYLYLTKEFASNLKHTPFLYFVDQDKNLRVLLRYLMYELVLVKIL